MADDCQFDGCPDLMDVPLSSEYNRMARLDKDILCDVERIIVDYLLSFDQQSSEGEQFDEEFFAFTSHLELEDWAVIDGCLQTLNNNPEVPADISKVKKKRRDFSAEQILVLEQEFVKCRCPDSSTCGQIAKILKVSSRRVETWFKKRRVTEASVNCQSTSSGPVKLKLRLKKQSEVTDTWAILRPSPDDCSSLPACHLEEVLSSTSIAPASPKKNSSCHRDESEPISRIKIEHPYAQDEPVTAKPSTVNRRSKLNPQQLQVLEEEFAVSPYLRGERRQELAARLGLPENQLKNWFEYRRRCARKVSGDKKSERTTTSSKKRKYSEVSSTTTDIEFDALSVCSSTSWYQKDSQSYDSGFGLTSVEEKSSSKPWCTYEPTSLWQGCRPFTSEKEYSLISSLGLENMCPNVGMN